MTNKTGLALRGFVVAVATLGAGALAFAGVPHTFITGETLQAADLNASFGALDQRLAALEAKDPLAGTYPAVSGLGSGNSPANPLDIGGVWFCGGAPATLNVSSAPLTPGGPVTFSNAFGSILFSNGGALSLNLDFLAPVCNPPNVMCAAPITFFLQSPRAQTLTIRTALDNVGSIYVDGATVASGLGQFPNTSSVPIPAGPFALSFLACSNDGPTIAFAVYDTFLTNAAYGLTVDYDRTFHRNGK